MPLQVDPLNLTLIGSFLVYPPEHFGLPPRAYEPNEA
jgi:hypothetical protein